MKLNAKIISILIICVIAIGLVLTKMGIIGESTPTTGGNVPAVPVAAGPPAPFVKAVVVQPISIEDKITSKGSILANEEVIITSEVSGKISRILFQEGDRVAAGTLLVSIDDTELKAQLQQQQVELEYLTKKEEREAKLLEKGGVSEQQYEATVRDRKSTQAEIELLKVRLAKMQIRAPFDGLIGFRFVSEGSYISPATKIANLVDISPIKIDFSVPEKYASVVKKGTSIRFTVDGMEGEFEGKVYAIEPKIDPDTRTLLLRAVSANQEAKLLPGAFANIRIILSRTEQALCIPSQAIIPEMNAKRVFVMKGGKATSVEVKTGLRLPSMVQVIEGLSAGDTVLTAGIMQVRSGSPVEITEVSQVTID